MGPCWVNVGVSRYFKGLRAFDTDLVVSCSHVLAPSSLQVPRVIMNELGNAGADALR